MRANRYVSYLAAEIEPQALANARNFEREIEKTLDRIAQKSNRGSGAFASAALGTGVTRNLTSISTGAAKTKRDLDLLDATQVKISRSASVMSASFSRAADALQIVQGPLGPIAGRLSALGQVLRSLAGFTLAGVLAGGGAFALGSISTQYQKMHDTLVPLFNDQVQLNGAMNDVVRIAQKTHQALQPVADTYAQITRVSRDAGISQARAARLAETVVKAAQSGGGTQEGKAAALLQFGQALGNNFKSSSQELNSILEQAYPLAQAIAKGLGVKTSELKKLAEDGRLSTEIVTQALERSAAEIDANFQRLPPRVGKSITDLTNNLSVFIGKMDATVGATTGVATAIEFVADHLRGLTVLAGTVAAAYSAKLFSGAIEGASNFAFRLSAIAPLTAEQIATNELFKRSLQERAAAEVAGAEAAVVSAREYQVQLRAQIVLLEKQIATQARAVEMARTLNAASRTSGGNGSSAATIGSINDLQASERALIATNAQLIASDAELTAAEARLAAATTGLTVANGELAAAETAAAGATGRLAGAKAVLQGAMTRVQGIASGLVNFLGGPWGVAFTAAGAAAFYLATRTDAAKDAADRFSGSQADLQRILGTTTNELYKQTDAARGLAQALAQAQLIKARGVAQDANASLGRSLKGASQRLPINSQDYRLLSSAGDALQAGRKLTDQGRAKVLDIFNRNPDLQKSSYLRSLLGSDAADIPQKIVGVAVATDELTKATQEFGDVQKALAKPRQLPSLLGPPGSGKSSKSLLNAQARALAAQDPLSKARADLALAMKEGPKSGEDEEAYKQRIAGLIQNVNGLAQAHKNAASQKSKDRAAQAALNKELRLEEQGRDKLDKLRGIQDQFSEDTPIKRLEKLRDAAREAKRQVDDLVGERVGDKIFSAADAKGVKDQIDTYTAAQERKPVTESLNAANQELAVQRLIAQGLGDQAEFLRRRVELEKQVGPLRADEAQDIRDQIAQEHKLNDAIENRQALIENNARALDDFRDVVQGTIKSLLKGDLKGAVTGFVKGVQEAYLNAKANELTMKLIGDPGKKYRDEMYRGLNNSADQLKGSADNLDKSADSLDRAATAIQNAASGGATAGSDLIKTNAGTTTLDGIGTLFDLVTGGQSTKAASPPISPDSIVITAPKLKGRGVAGIDQVFGQQLGSFGSNAVGMAISAVNSLFGGVGTQGGYKGSGVSDVLGGIAQSAAQAFPALGAGMAVTSVISKVLGVKNFAGGAFGILGNLVAKAFGFGKAKKGSATITDLSGSYGISGNSGSAKEAAGGAADSVISGLQRVADALGASIGAFSVSIGTRHGDYRVDPTGRGNTKIDNGAIDFNGDQEAAVRYAILNAIQDGAIKGIREGTQRLLAAGKDLDSALDKAVKFEGVFKALKRLKDPVGAAIDDLNVEFQNLISIFKEAGASAEEWSQLQELYDLERADAIKQATKDTVSALSDFITSLTSGPDSPLSRRTVYDNARAEVDKFRSDIAAGKVVDQDALVKALDNFQSASQNIFGSRGAFYTDFNDILALATRARDTATSAATTTTPGSALPPSPFDALTPIATQQLGATNAGNDLLTQIRDGVLALGGGGGSTIDTLPYYSGGGAYSTLADKFNVRDL